MGLFNWLFGKADPREVLSQGEEWAVPEEWYTDGDGTAVRRKKRKCCGGHCHRQEATETAAFPLMTLPLAPVVTELPDACDEQEDTPLEPKEDSVSLAKELTEGMQQLASDLEQGKTVEVVKVAEVATVTDSQEGTKNSTSYGTDNGVDW